MEGTDETPFDVGFDVDLDKVWVGVAAQVWRRRPGRVERLVGRMLRSPGLARALLTTPSLLVPWLLASIGVMAAGALATAATGEPLVALLAPAMAGAGIAYSYGPGMDPAWELACSMAINESMVLLTRALAVFAVNAVLALAASVVCPAAAGIALGWFVPMTAVSMLALAAATLSRSANIGVSTAVVAWTLTVLASSSATGRFAAAVDGGLTLLLPYLLVAVCCAAIVVHRPATPRGNS